MLGEKGKHNIVKNGKQGECELMELKKILRDVVKKAICFSLLPKSLVLKCFEHLWQVEGSP